MMKLDAINIVEELGLAPERKSMIIISKTLKILRKYGIIRVANGKIIVRIEKE